MLKQNIYIGNTSENGILNYTLVNGKLYFKSSNNDYERCTYLAQNKTHVYGTIEVKKGSIVAYKKEKNDLKYINEKSSYGENPCHIEIDNKNKLIFVSNYNNGYLTIFKINKNGTIGEKVYSRVEDKLKSHMHCVKIYKNNKYFFSVDIGEDLLTAYKIKENEIKIVDRLKFEKDTQPRHIAISEKNIYVITEKHCKLFIIEMSKEKLRIKKEVSLLPENIEIKENYTGCAIKLTKNSKNLYVTIRGHNSISVYKNYKNDIRLIQNISCQGDVPRDLTLDRKEKYVLVANQESNEIAVFKRNRRTGTIKYNYKELVKGPTCVIIK